MFRSVYIAIISFFCGVHYWVITEVATHNGWFGIIFTAIMVAAVIGGYWIAATIDYTINSWWQTQKARRAHERQVYREYIAGLKDNGLWK